MLRNVDDLYGFSVAGSDGPIGEVRDCYFDDQAWTVRFFVVETGPWLGGRKVLISPIALHGLHWADKALSVSVTQKQVKNSPDVDTSKPCRGNMRWSSSATTAIRTTGAKGTSGAAARDRGRA